MSQQPFRRTCFCSFAPHGHVLTSRAEWHRHLAFRRAEQIDARLATQTPQSSRSQQNTQHNRRTTASQVPYQPRNSPGSTNLVSNRLTNVHPDTRNNEQQQHDRERARSVGIAELGLSAFASQHDLNPQENHERSESAEIETHGLLESDNMEMENPLMDSSPPPEPREDRFVALEEQHQCSIGTGRIDHGPDQDALGSILNEIRDDNDERVGQMRTGLAAIIEDEDMISFSDEESDTEVMLPNSRANEESAFDYENVQGDLLTEKEVLSLALWDIYTRYNTPRRAEHAIKETLDALGHGPQDMRTVRKFISKRTGLNPIYYDCCKNSCMSFALHPDATQCHHCGHERWKTVSSAHRRHAPNPEQSADHDNIFPPVPWAQHIYIPVAHRLRLAWADKARATEMIHYRNTATLDRNEELHSDFWSGDFCERLKGKGIFTKDTDIAFFLSTDGVRVFKSHTTFSIWPLLLVNLNLPAKVRLKRRNMICVGFIPGPKEPKDMDSFLFPLIEEFLKLGEGIPDVFNSARQHNSIESRFTMRAFITVVGCDMVGRAKVMNTLGNRAYSYCEYCKIRGIWNRGVYCPCDLPVDGPFIHDSEEQDTDRRSLPLRTHSEFCDIAQHITRTMCRECPKKHGIRGAAIISRLPSIEFPTSFPPDLMHLMYENIVPALFRHYRGVFGVGAPERLDVPTQDSHHNSDSDSQATTTSNTNLEDTPVARPTRRTAKFVRTSDPWNVTPNEWKEVGKAFENSAQSVPNVFGEPLRNFYSHVQELKAAEWATVAKIGGPVFLSTLLPEEDYEGFIQLVKSIILLERYSFNEDDFQCIQSHILTFSSYYESRFYGRRYANLRACLPSIHQLLHIPHFLRQIGPMYAYWQWPMERFCGMIKATAKSKVSANVNMGNRLLVEEQKNLLPYVLPTEALRSLHDDEDREEHEADADNTDGVLQLSRILTSSLRNAQQLVAVSQNSNNTGSPSNLKYILPCRNHILDDSETRSLITYLRLQRGWSGDVLEDLPIHECLRWAGLTIPANHNRQGFQVNAKKLARSNSTHCSSSIRFDSRYGTVLLFLSITFSDNQIMELAYIEEFFVGRLGQLLYKSRIGQRKMIDINCIEELVGFFGWEGKEYVIRKSGALW